MELLFRFDFDLAAKARTAGCIYCGGRLDSARYPRKPRGGPESLGPEYDFRLSFCCSREGCRRRVTPPSVRFLGRKVYLAAVVVLVTAMMHGANAKRMARLHELFDISLDTLARWRSFWQEAFAQSPFWKAAKGLLARPVNTTMLPRSLLACFGGNGQARLVAVLKFVSPITTASARDAAAF